MDYTTKKNIIARGWHLTQSPITKLFKLYIPIDDTVDSTENSYIATSNDQDIWLQISESIVYILDWQYNARVLIENDILENKNKNQNFEYAFPSKELTQSIMNGMSEK